MIDMTTACIAAMFALGVSFSYLLVQGTGKWSRLHWCGKGCIVMLVVMACQARQERTVSRRASLASERVIESAAQVVIDIERAAERLRHGKEAIAATTR